MDWQHPGIVLRPATPDDAAAIMAIMDAAFDPRFGEAWTASQLTSLFALPGADVRLALADGVAAGFCAARLAGPESELLLLAVAPAARRRGLGRALLDHWLDWAAAAGASEAFLEMRADNPARALYESAAFSACGQRADYYRGGDGLLRDAITMRRLLNAK
jgi:ribosomal-protein-alanine N-acetyltransferase